MNVDPPKRRASTAPPRPVDDMDDGAEIEALKRRVAAGESDIAPLADFLGRFQAVAGDPYRRADGLAKTRQGRFRLAAWVSVTAGVIAVLLGIFQLFRLSAIPPLPSPLALPIAELILVGIAIGAVLWAFHCELHLGWLAERSKAERLRALKYRAMLDPATWAGRLNSTVLRIEESVREISTGDPEELPSSVDDPVEVPDPAGVLTGSAPLHAAIAEHYLNRRLAAQADFCLRKTERLHHADRKTKMIGPLLFFFVLVFVFAHAAFDSVDHARHGTGPVEQPDPISHTATRVLIVLAAALPLFAAGLHTYRSGREFGRNMRRFKATYLSLSKIQTQLETAPSAEQQFAAMLRSEYVLAHEHQQWLQLMIECEWFG